MSVLVKFGSRKAIIRGGRWMCADRNLETALNDETSRWIKETGGPGLRDRNQERTVAKEIARRKGGKVSLTVKSKSRRSSDYFFQQRQLSLEFDSFIPVKAKRASA